MWCWRHSFRIVSCESPKTMRKLYLSIKFPHREIRSNYGIFRSDHNRCLIGPKHSSDILLKKWFHHECFPGYFLKFWKKLFMRTAYQKITVLLEWSILFFMNNLCHSEFLVLWNIILMWQNFAYFASWRIFIKLSWVCFCWVKHVFQNISLILTRV